jgi:hypothetical protein
MPANLTPQYLEAEARYRAASDPDEKLAALDTEDYLRERAQGASREQFLDALSRVPDIPPDPGDEL